MKKKTEKKNKITVDDSQTTAQKWIFFRKFSTREERWALLKKSLFCEACFLFFIGSRDLFGGCWLCCCCYFCECITKTSYMLSVISIFVGSHGLSSHDTDTLHIMQCPFIVSSTRKKSKKRKSVRKILFINCKTTQRMVFFKYIFLFNVHDLRGWK